MCCGIQEMFLYMSCVCTSVCVSLLEPLMGLLLLLSLFMVWLTVCAAWQEHNGESLRIPSTQHNTPLPLKLLHHHPLTKKKMDNKIYFFFIFFTVCWMQRVRVGKNSSIEMQAQCCSVPLVGVNVVWGDEFDWSTGGFSQGLGLAL